MHLKYYSVLASKSNNPPSMYERIMDRFDILDEHLDDVQKQRNSIDGEELLDNQDLLQMLKKEFINFKSLSIKKWEDKKQAEDTLKTNSWVDNPRITRSRITQGILEFIEEHG